METLLIIDDEKNYLLVLEDLLSEAGYQVLTADSGSKGLELALASDLDVLITDMKMPGLDGMTLLDRVHAEKPDLPVIMMTAFGSVEKAVEAMRKGAFDYILKPFKNEELKLTIRKAYEHHQLLRRNRYLTQELQDRYQFSNIIGKSAPMQRVYELIEKVAPAKATVLITGESGTGKELIARAIHFNSPRRDMPFITVNCGALPETLLESELFGHEKGSFSGAISQRKGRFELAHEGTLFLDEITEMSPPLQVKLLRVLQELEFERVGGSTTLRVDVRVVAASNRNLKEEVAAGRFRSDLFYRLNVVHVLMPPLRDRSDDIPVLVSHFLNKYGKGAGKPKISIDSDALRCLMDYQWPGNVRELENAIERAVILASGDRIEVRDIPAEIASSGQQQPLEGIVQNERREARAEEPSGAVVPDVGERLPVTGLRPRQHKAIEFVKQHGFITNKHYSQINGISERQALRELNEMVEAGHLNRAGKGRGVHYVSS
ncbi:MAG: sigma 54-interacting transcriptional regulator [Syntrophobacteraceae bacterium]